MDRTAIAGSKIPWEHRKRIGRFGAYWKTAWLATRHPLKLAEEVARPVKYRDARWFQAVTVVLAYIPIAAGIMAWYLGDGLRRAEQVAAIFWIAPGRDESANRIMVTVTAVIMLLGALLFLTLATGLASYFFHPRTLGVEQQNRAIALSYYACAPLAWIAPMVAVGALLLAANALLEFRQIEIPWRILRLLLLPPMILLASAYVMPLVWWIDTLALLRCAARASLLRLLAAAILTPVACLLLLGLIATIHAAASFIVLVLRSL